MRRFAQRAPWRPRHRGPADNHGDTLFSDTGVPMVGTVAPLIPPIFGGVNNAVSTMAGVATFAISTTHGREYRIVYKHDLMDPDPWINPVAPPLPEGWVSGGFP
jgi:hypothetical protein